MRKISFNALEHLKETVGSMRFFASCLESSVSAETCPEDTAKRCIENLKFFANDIAATLLAEEMSKPKAHIPIRKALAEIEMDCTEMSEREGIKNPAFASIFDIYAKKCRDALDAPVRRFEKFSRDEAEEEYQKVVGRPWNNDEDELACWLYGKEEESHGTVG